MPEPTLLRSSYCALAGSSVLLVPSCTPLGFTLFTSKPARFRYALFLHRSVLLLCSRSVPLWPLGRPLGFDILPPNPALFPYCPPARTFLFAFSAHYLSFARLYCTGASSCVLQLVASLGGARRRNSERVGKSPPPPPVTAPPSPRSQRVRSSGCHALVARDAATCVMVSSHDPTPNTDSSRLGRHTGLPSAPKCISSQTLCRQTPGTFPYHSRSTAAARS